MSKLKDQIIRNNEEAFRRIFEKSKYSHGSPSPLPLPMPFQEPSDEELARYDADFNAWLDDYERSFGDGEFL